LIVALVNDPAFVLALSLISGFTEILMRYTLKYRDQLIYKCCLSRFVPEKNAWAFFKSERSKLVRANSAMAETVGDVGAAWLGILSVVLFDISSDAATP
jgi:hypothetical protein